jgi:hypothetical protein
MAETVGTAVVEDPAAVEDVTPEDVTVPDWLNEPEYKDIIADESSKTILSRYKSRDEAVKAIVEKEKLLGSNFRIPKKLNDTQKSELAKRMAVINEVPENAEGYTLVRPDKIDEDLDFTEQTKMELRAFAKESGIGARTLQGLYEKAMSWSQRAKEQMIIDHKESVEKQRQSVVAIMQKYLGPQEYTQRLPLIDSFMKSRAIDDAEYADFEKQLNASGLRNHPILFKALADAAGWAQIMEGTGKILPGQFQPSKANAKLSREALNAKRYPNTPVSLGGGKPG